MRIIYLSKAILTVLFSCAKNSEQINVAKNEVEKNVSEVEKKESTILVMKCLTERRTVKL
jgi:hypothetical protein